MNASRPEARSEYSRGQAASNGPEGPDAASVRAAGSARGRVSRAAVPAAATAGGLLLIFAELTPVLAIHSPLYGQASRTISGGSHNSWSLLPVAALVIALALVQWIAPARRASLGALTALGLAALAIALLVDLRDVHRSGLIGSTASGLFNARAHAGIGLYLETLGAVVVILAAVAGALLSPRDLAGARARGHAPGTPTSAS